MRVGLRGLLRSGDRAHTIAVLYSLDADGLTGRLRPMDPNSAWPPWLAEASRVGCRVMMNRPYARASRWSKHPP